MALFLRNSKFKTIALTILGSVVFQSGFQPSALAQSTPLNPQAAQPATSPNTQCKMVQSLTQSEQENARIAWQYFLKNYQPQTGFVNAVADYPSTSIWDLGNYLMALNAARSLDLNNQADFDYRLNTFLTTLDRLPLFENSLPNKAYNTQTAQMTDYTNKPSKEGTGWSAIDLGRVLTALHTIRQCHPQYSNWIQGSLDRWDLQRAVVGEQLFGITVQKGKPLFAQEGRLGYEEYAAKGFRLWGFNPKKALDRSLNRKFVEIYGLQIPIDRRDYQTTNGSNYVLSEPYILEGLEFGFEDEEFAKNSATILEVQKRRFEDTGKLTAVTEDHIKGSPHFLYSTIYANGTPWATITDTNEAYPQLRTISTKSAFGWRYLYPDSTYAQQLLQSVEGSRNTNGFYAGVYESNNKPNDILTTNTNAIVLESLAYKARGNQPIATLGSTSGSTLASTSGVTLASAPIALSREKALFPRTTKVRKSTKFPKSTKPIQPTTPVQPTTPIQSTTPVQSSQSPILLGAYTPGYLGTQSVVDQSLNGLSDWSGKKLSIAGVFIELEDPNPAYNVPMQLETAKRNGYTSFVNLTSKRTAAEIANGSIDPALKRLAESYATWIKGGSDRVAYLAPLPEMNGDWETYKEDPENFKRAYQRIQKFFTEAGVPRESVRWVFAPNGWTKSSQHQFENYYPGDSNTDVVSFSAYNWGYCANSTWKEWSKPETTFGPYLKRLRTLAPSKPIFIAQTASTSENRNGSNTADKDEWFRQNYAYLAQSPGVRGVIYFNIQKECDWALYNPNGPNTQGNQGYKDAVSNPAFGYISPSDLAKTTLRP